MTLALRSLLLFDFVSYALLGKGEMLKGYAGYVGYMHTGKSADTNCTVFSADFGVDLVEKKTGLDGYVRHLQY